ncbi:hypothetical protein B0H14DRAFT_2418268, partial [Mycena olivaceomarginata]
LLSSLASRLSPDVRILQDAQSPDCTASLARGSNYGVKMPFAIVQPASEDDIRVVHIVRESAKASVPFVSASGGHSPWSTIGEDGIRQPAPVQGDGG